MSSREVKKSHKKACLHCGYENWGAGDYFVANSAPPWDYEKYCVGCARERFVRKVASKRDA